MDGFRRGIGTSAKTKLDVGTLQMQLDYLGVVSKQSTELPLALCSK